MYIPIKVDYGVRALVDLAVNGTDGPVRASEIAKRTVIPEQYLAQVLAHAEQERVHGKPARTARRSFSRDGAVGHQAERRDDEPGGYGVAGGVSVGQYHLRSFGFAARSAKCGAPWRRRCSIYWTPTTIEDLVNSTPVQPDRAGESEFPVRLKAAV